MKKLKYVIYAIVIIIYLPRLLMLAKPISYWVDAHSATEIEINYSNNLLLLGDYYFDDNDWIFLDDYDLPENSKYVLCGYSSDAELYSEKVIIKLPNQSDNVIIETYSDKKYSYNIESCFEDGNNYCVLFRLSPNLRSLNSKTHRGDRLVILDKSGEIKFSLETTADEWVLDCVDNNALIYNVSENSFYYKNVETGVVGEKITNGFIKRVKSIAFSKENEIWTADYRVGVQVESYVIEL